LAQFSFDPRTVTKEYTNFEPLPPGWYKAVVCESEIIENSAKTGLRLMLTYQIIEGQYTNRKITQGYNIANPNPQSVEIALSEVKAICACVGKFNPIAHSEEIHGIPMQINVRKQKDADYNEVKGYKDVNGNDPGKAGQGAPAPQIPQPPQGYAQPAQPQYAQPPAAPAQPGFGGAPPAWAPPAPAAPPAQPQYGQQPPQQPPAAPAWAPGAPAAPAPAPAYQVPVAQGAPAPAWQPNTAPPDAPAWAPQR
jgi:hypothetical protein